MSRTTEEVDYFAVLGVGVDADDAEMKAAFKAKAKLMHPDKGGDEAEFKALGEAYQELLTPEGRAKALRARAGKGVRGAFDELFDGLPPEPPPYRPRKRRGTDVHRRLEIGVAEALRGGLHVLHNASSPCALCAGTGRTGGAPRRCPDCGGGGVLRRRLGMVWGDGPCGACEGTGVLRAVPCVVCAGAGSTGSGGVEVTVPPETRSGTVITVRGAGVPGTGVSAAGDLLVEVVVTAPEGFLRSGEDVRASVLVPVWDAALGADVEVPLPEGGVFALRVPAGTQPDAEFVVEGGGLPLGPGQRGRMTVVVRVEVPDATAEPFMSLFKAMRQPSVARIRA